MKNIIYAVILIWGGQSLLSANPIDATPLAKFSELIFTNDTTWVMEILLPFNELGYNPDSVLLKTTSDSAAILPSFFQDSTIFTITTASLTKPLKIDRQGDSLTLYTYSNIFYEQIRTDQLLFGDVAGATVGKPESGYSILRYSCRDEYRNYLTIDCLTLNSTLDAINDTLGLCATMTGRMFDTNNNPVNAFKVSHANPGYLTLHTPIYFDGNGVYHTKIFRKFPTESVNYFNVHLEDFTGWRDTVHVQFFSLENIQPDTSVFQDIYMLNNSYLTTGIESKGPQPDYNLELINYPNPFNATTNFNINIPSSWHLKHACINIYSITGQRIKSIPVQDRAKVQWNGTDINGRVMPTGIYYYQLDLDNKTIKSGSMLLLK